jgi:hypothetical protein
MNAMIGKAAPPAHMSSMALATDGGGWQSLA